MSEKRIELDGGKYTYVFNNGEQYALRYGEPWRDLVGDNLVYWMGFEIEKTQQQRDQLLAALKLAVSEAVADSFDDWYANAQSVIAEVEKTNG